MAGEFYYEEIPGRARLLSFTRIVAPPVGFEEMAPYRIGIADLPGAGRILAWIGSTVPDDRIAIGMDLTVVPRIRADAGGPRAYYTLEMPG